MYREDRPLAGRTLHFDLSLMHLYELAHQMKPNARTRRVAMPAREETLKNRFQILGRNAFAIVFDRDNSLLLCFFQTKQDAPPFGRKLKSIREEIRQHLLHFVGIHP